MFFTSCMSAPTNPSTICFVPKLFYTTSKNKNKSRLLQFFKKFLILKSFNLCPEPFQNKTTFLQKKLSKNQIWKENIRLWSFTLYSHHPKTGRIPHLKRHLSLISPSNRKLSPNFLVTLVLWRLYSALKQNIFP